MGSPAFSPSTTIGSPGANLNETILNTSNVKPGTFGKLKALAVTGQVYAQPLYVPSLSTSTGIKNVVFIATEANDVYAYNADSPWDLVWSRTNFEMPWASTACSNTSRCWASAAHRSSIRLRRRCT